MQNSEDTQTSKLGLGSLVFNTIGMSLGGAIVSYIGFAIALGGRSTIFTVLICLLIGIGLALPFYMLSKLATVKGSQYSIIMENLGPKIGGLTQYIYITDIIFYATYPLAISSYIVALFPNLNKTAVAIGIVLIVYVILMIGIEGFARFQSLFTIILLIALTLFSIIGIYYLVNNNINPFNFNEPNYFYKGMDGITAGIPLLIFYTFGYYYILYYGPVAKRPTKNIPKAMLVGGGAMIISWVVITIVGANVLPIEQVANQPLTVVAEEIMPKYLALFFVIGGPIMAILTSYLGLVPVTTAGMLQTAKEGWFPKVLAKKSKKGTPIVIYTLLQGAILIIVSLEIPITALLYQFAFITAIATVVLYVAILRLPKSHPELFDRAGAKVTSMSYRIASMIAIVLALVIFYLSIQGVSVIQILINVVAIALLYLLSNYLVNTGKVHVEENFELDVEDTEPRTGGVIQGPSFNEQLKM